MVELTKEERRILGHSLGLDTHRGRGIPKIYRNRFCSCPGHSEQPLIDSLVQKACMVESNIEGFLYHVTQYGVEALRAGDRRDYRVSLRHAPVYFPVLVKVFRMNDCDWVAAPTLEEAKDWYQQTFRPTDDEADLFDGPSEVDDTHMNGMLFRDEDGPETLTRTFREQLNLMIERGESFPAFFASTEY
jgi:hypothetical protein